MAFNPLQEKGIPLEKQLRNWEMLVGRPYDKNEIHPYTKARIILMNGIEVEASLFLHEFHRMEKNRDVKEKIAMTRRIEQQQQKAVAGLVPGDETILENTIGYEQLAVDLTAYLAQTCTDPYVKQVFDFGLLEDFDHLYRYSNLMETLEGTRAETLVRDFTEIIPGRPTMAEHRHPFDSIRKSADRKNLDPKDLLYILTLVSGEQQTMNFYMNMGNRLVDPVGRGLYTEIAMIEEQHVSQYGSLLDPTMNWYEMMVCHEYNECYLYHSFMEQEIDPEVKSMWELHLDMELGHLKSAVDLTKKYTKQDPAEILPSKLPEPILLQPNIEYVRHILSTQVDFTADGTEIVPVDQLDPSHRYFTYQDMVNGEWIPSENVIIDHERIFGSDYRYQVNGQKKAKKRA
ncbi:MAG: hypothetical protein ACYDHW_00330 [Syntrophorhabdaceae bacterium]